MSDDNLLLVFALAVATLFGILGAKIKEAVTWDRSCAVACEQRGSKEFERVRDRCVCEDGTVLRSDASRAWYVP